MKTLKRITFTLLLSVSVTGMAESLQYSTENGAIDGYDPVSYFSAGEAQRGSAEYIAEWNNASWHFTSAENRDAFITNPEKYAPQFGGFCALGMAHGGDVPTDPTAWTVWEGKLYLNMIDEVTTTWRYNPDRLIARASIKWEELNRDVE